MAEPLWGAEAVLAGIGLSKTVRGQLVAAWRPLVGSGMDAQMKVLNAFVSLRGVRWPWFDDCLARFQALGQYPNTPGWDVFEPTESEPEPVVPGDAVAWIGIDDARSLLKENGVKPGGRKHSDIYRALVERVPFERWRQLALDEWRRDVARRIEGPDADEVEYARMQLLASAMSAADFVAGRVEQLHEMVQSGSLSGIRVEPDDAIAQAAMHDPSPYCPHQGLPPFFPGDRSGVSGIRAERVVSAMPAGKEDRQSIAAGTARGIANEKTSESIAVFQVIGAVILGWIVGAVSDIPLLGVAVIIGLMVPIWKGYKR